MYPVDVTADFGDGTRSRGWALLGVLLGIKLLLLLPHFILLSVLGWVAMVVSWFGYWVVLFTGALPEFFFVFPERVLAWQVRIYGWMVTLTDDYPPFEWEPAAYPVRMTTIEGPGPRNRFLAGLGIIFLKAIAVLPHLIVLMFVWLAGLVAIIAGYVTVLFTGKIPEGIFAFIVGVERWSIRVSSWIYTLTDVYPPFRLSA